MRYVCGGKTIDKTSINCYIRSMTNEEFYVECAKLLDTTYDCKPFPWTHSKRTRWNNRQPGSGRYPGHGLIRCYGNLVHVNLHTPVKFDKTFNSMEEALEELKKILAV